MARPKGSKNRPKDGAPPAKQKGQVHQDLTGHNSGLPPDGVIVHHALRMVKKEAERAKVREQWRAEDKKHSHDAINDGVSLKLIKNRMEFDKLTKGDQVQRLNQERHYSRALRVKASGHMGNLIDMANEGSSEQAILARAHEAGIKDGMFARDRDKDTYDITTPAGQEYERGYQIGQEQNVGALAKMQAPDARPGKDAKPPKAEPAAKDSDGVAAAKVASPPTAPSADDGWTSDDPPADEPEMKASEPPIDIASRRRAPPPPAA